MKGHKPGVVLFRKILSGMLLLLLTLQDLHAQGSQQFFNHLNYYSLSAGFMFHQSQTGHNGYQIKAETSRDRALCFTWHRLLADNFGSLFKLEAASQSTRYTRREGDWLVTSERHPDYRYSGRISLTAALSYNFMAAKNLNLLISLGPQVHLNKRTPYYTTAFRQKNEISSRNTGAPGYGFNLGLHIIYKITERTFVFVNPSYQRGYLVFREAYIGDPMNYSVLKYSGSGASLFFGLIFRVSQEGQGKSEPEEQP